MAAGLSNGAFLGWNVNQPIDGSTPGTITPTLEGIYVDVSGIAETQLRLQINGPNWQNNPADHWCAPIPASPGVIPFGSFNTDCWPGGQGTVYDGEPIASLAVVVPGDMTSLVDFDLCVNELIEADADQAAPGLGCSVAEGPGEGTGPITGTEVRNVTRQGRSYIVQNNVLANPAAQILDVSGVSWKVTQQNNSVPTTSVWASHPSVFIGSNWGHASANNGMPHLVSSLTDIRTGLRWSDASGEMNVSYDVWFSTTAQGDAGNPSGGYLMVWLHDPANAQPLGSPVGSTALAGKAWQVWECPGPCQNGKPVITYLPSVGSVSEMSFDLNDFIQDAIANSSVIQSTWYLTNIFAGFQIWNGAVNATVHDFCAIVE